MGAGGKRTGGAYWGLLASLTRSRAADSARDTTIHCISMVPAQSIRLLVTLFGSMAVHAAPLLAQLPETDGDPDVRPTVELTILDVGVGSAAVVRAPGGETILVDGGPGESLRFLQQMRVDSLALVVAGDAAPEHMRGLLDVVTARPVGRLAFGRPGDPGEDWTRLQAALGRLESIAPIEVDSVVPLTVGALDVRLVPDRGAGRGTVGVFVSYGDFSAFLPADADGATLRSWLLGGELEPSTVLVAPAHGSVRGIERNAFRALSPEVVVVSADAGLLGGGPHPAALTAYAAQADTILRTDRDGHVSVLGFQDGSYVLSVSEGAESSPAEEDAVRSDADRLTDAGVIGTTLPYLTLEVRPNGAVGREGLNGEHVTIRNAGPSRIPMSGWTLCDLSSRCFRFPPGSGVGAGDIVRVHTGVGHADGHAFFMNHTTEVWNDDGDEATLRDPAGRIMARSVY